MTDTRVLLNRISSLRQRLEQRPAPAAETPAEEPDRVRRLERQVEAGTRHATLVDGSFRQLDEAKAAGEGFALPQQLTSRARRLLLTGQQLLTSLRGLADVFRAETRPAGSDIPALGCWVGIDYADPLAVRYRETAAMLDTALRTVQAYPDSPGAQLRLCDGLEATLGVVSERSAALKYAVGRRKHEALRLDRLATLLLDLADGGAVEIAAFQTLAESVLADAEQGQALRFEHIEPLADLQSEHARLWQARAVACHCLTVAQVVARLVRHDPEVRVQPVDAVLAALLHDVGMLRVPVTVYGHPGPLDEEQRRLLESHTRLGGELTLKLWPSAGWLTEAALSHHERHDGTGYPAGLREMQVAPLARFLAVCDVYAALCTPRPHRPAREPRTALTDALLLADKGALDRSCAERLLQLSFYPVGSVVEMADGAVGLVVAAPSVRIDLTTPSRPVVQVLTDGHGHFLPLPRHLNLAECEGHTIVRSLTAAERRRLLGKRYPELA